MFIGSYKITKKLIIFASQNILKYCEYDIGMQLITFNYFE
jgi:hypothetical protein